MVKYHLYCDRKVKWGLETCGSEGENVCLFVFKDMVSSTWEEKVGELRPSWVIWTTWVIWDHVFKQKKKVVPFHSGLCHMRAGPKGHGLGIPHNRDSQVHAWFHVWLLQPLLRCLTPWCCWEGKKSLNCVPMLKYLVLLTKPFYWMLAFWVPHMDATKLCSLT